MVPGPNSNISINHLLKFIWLSYPFSPLKFQAGSTLFLLQWNLDIRVCVYWTGKNNKLLLNGGSIFSIYVTITQGLKKMVCYIK